MSRIRTWPLVAGASLLAALLLSACGGPAPHYFALTSGSGPAAGPPVASLPSLGLAVGPLDIPRYLDRPEIVTEKKAGPEELQVAVANRWGGSLDTDILRVVGDDLGRLLGTVRVVVYPAQPHFAPDYRVLLDLREFGGVLGQPVTLRLRWTILAAPDARAVAVEESDIQQPTASASYPDLVTAESAALGTVTRQIAERIASLGSPASH
jgi:uncharacterized lipoprotein YmbA